VPSISSTSTSNPPRKVPAGAGHYLADLYTFQWSALNLCLPAVSASTVALCLFTGVAVGHPAAGMIAGGGALTIGFGANQRISDSRLLPMIFAVFAMASATLVGTVVGHKGPLLILASAVAAAIYGLLTIRNSGLAWVGQQAAVALFVASAFPSGPRPAFARAGLIVAGGTMQILITSAGLRLYPELGRQLRDFPRSILDAIPSHDLLKTLQQLPYVLPAPDRRAAAIYSLRLVITVAIASELYRRLGIQSGYWIPMTALLVQKPAFFETLSRGIARVGGTLAGATLATILAAHVPLGPWWLAGLATFFAYWCFATNGVNYALFSLCITSYIVFLLSLNQIPGPELAHRRALCTLAGAVIALVIHLDALRRHRAESSGVVSEAAG
jgi:hypothetical protein